MTEPTEPAAREDVTERMARAWASIDGKARRFDDDKAGKLDELDGTYEGYMAEARELIRRAGLALPHMPTVAGWQPIETAPKDHFPVLAWSMEYGRVVAFQDVTWTWWPCPATKPLPEAPTHWMPLPAAPQGPRKED